MTGLLLWCGLSVPLALATGAVLARGTHATVPAQELAPRVDRRQ